MEKLIIDKIEGKVAQDLVNQKVTVSFTRPIEDVPKEVLFGITRYWGGDANLVNVAYFDKFFKYLTNSVRKTGGIHGSELNHIFGSAIVSGDPTSLEYTMAPFTILRFFLRDTLKISNIKNPQIKTSIRTAIQPYTELYLIPEILDTNTLEIKKWVLKKQLKSGDDSQLLSTICQYIGEISDISKLVLKTINYR